MNREKSPLAKSETKKGLAMVQYLSRIVKDFVMLIQCYRISDMFIAFV